MTCGLNDRTAVTNAFADQTLADRMLCLTMISVTVAASNPANEAANGSASSARNLLAWFA